MVLADLQGKASAQRSLSGYFCGCKSNWPPRGQERDKVSSIQQKPVICFSIAYKIFSLVPRFGNDILFLLLTKEPKIKAAVWIFIKQPKPYSANTL